MKDASIQVELGSFGSRSGEMNFKFIAQNNGSIRIQVYAYDPSDLRKSGVIINLDTNQYQNLKSLIQHTDEMIEQMRTPRQNSNMFPHTDSAHRSLLLEQPTALQHCHQQGSSSHRSAFRSFYGFIALVAVGVLGYYIWSYLPKEANINATPSSPTPISMEISDPEPVIVFPRAVIAAKDIRVPLQHGLMTILKGKEFTLLAENPDGFEAKQGRITFAVSKNDFKEK